jgi:redox-sensitive bicupin YhaK (pirin superfamily)
MTAAPTPSPRPDPPADVVEQSVPLGFPWPTVDPFLFCVHHDDAYPEGNEAMGPATSLAGRDLGMDFAGIDGFRMYHGRVVPGFPQHPHRGFETVTFVRRGLIDHSDSLGATARFGRGDTQWLTAGRGIVHSEMFPLVEQDRPNPTELFQIWLNLPAADKLADPHFTMLWGRDIPRVRATDAEGRAAEITVIAGELDGARPPSPPPSSWASRPDTDVAIWHVRLDPDATWELPAAATDGAVRVLYAYEGTVTVGVHAVTDPSALVVRPEVPVALTAGDGGAELLLLQGRPIGEPVAQQGPFVMNTDAELGQAFRDYHETGFGGWPFADDGPVHPRERARFARHADGRVEEAEPAA